MKPSISERHSSRVSGSHLAIAWSENGREQEAARPGVQWRVGGDRRRADLVVLQLLGDVGVRLVAFLRAGADRGNENVAGGEVLEVLGDREEVCVAGGHPGAGPALGVRYRALLAQLVPDGERVLDVVGVEDVVVGRPVFVLVSGSVGLGRGLFFLLESQGGFLLRGR